jgi:hypothetical protein
MAKRLQVILQDVEYREIKRAAGARQLTIAAWVRQALTAARQKEPSGEAGKKLACIRSAARQVYPTADIEQMLSQIEKGYESTPS